MSSRLGYFGPAGTFAEAAMHRVRAELSEWANAEPVPLATVARAIAAVRDGTVAGAVVPIENSVEGGVPATLDALAAGAPLQIRHEVVLPIRFVLGVQPGTTLQQVRVVATHPHAEAQCRAWLSDNLPAAAVRTSYSTAGAAEAVSLAGLLADPADRPDASVSSPEAARRYGLDVLAPDIADNPGAETRFVLVAHPSPAPAPTGADKTTMLLYMRADRSGALLAMLTELAVRGINMTRIESRPTRAGMGSYCFSIDAEGHLDEPRMGEAIMGLRRVCARVVFLGSYPRADRLSPQVREGTRLSDFDGAQSWLDRLRAGIVD